MCLPHPSHTLSLTREGLGQSGAIIGQPEVVGFGSPWDLNAKAEYGSHLDWIIIGKLDSLTSLLCVERESERETERQR